MPGRSLTIRGTTYPVLLPSIRDPRLHLAATIISLHVIGQLFLEFELSIAQILVSIGTCALLEVVLVLRQRAVIAWPASAMLTGNGVAFVLRVNGTEHGDWWSLHGWYVFAATSALALLSKYVIRVHDRPLFNPSNLGLVACFVILGTGIVNPLDFWWGPLSPAMIAVIVVIALGGLTVTRRVGMLPMSAAFWLAFAAGLAVVALAGHEISARWSLDPVGGWRLWTILVTSPEVLVFLLFMITDPVTTPLSRRFRLAFGAFVGVVAALTVGMSATEFWAKVGVLSALAIACAVRPLAARAVAGRSWSRGAVVGGVAAGLVVLPLALVAVTLPHQDDTTAAGRIDRPEVEVPPLPEVAIAADVDRITASISPASAELLAHDTVEALEVERLAIERGDLPMLETAVVGARLDASSALLGSGEASDVPRWDELTVVVVRDPLDPQAVPQLGLHAVSTEGEPVDTVYVVRDVGGTWLVEDERAPADAGI